MTVTPAASVLTLSPQGVTRFRTIILRVDAKYKKFKFLTPPRKIEHIKD
jgi:hypothetical protein